MNKSLETLRGFAAPKCGGCRDNPNCKYGIDGCFILEHTMRQGIDMDFEA